MALFAIGGDAGTGFLGDFFSEKKSLAQEGETKAPRKDANNDNALSIPLGMKPLVEQARAVKSDKPVGYRGAYSSRGSSVLPALVPPSRASYFFYAKPQPRDVPPIAHPAG